MRSQSPATIARAAPFCTKANVRDSSYELSYAFEKTLRNGYPSRAAQNSRSVLSIMPFFRSNEKKKPNPQLRSVFRQVRLTTLTTMQWTKNTVQETYTTVQSVRTRLRGGLLNVVRRTPPGGRLSDDYVYGCIDAVFTTIAVAVIAVAVRRASRHFATAEDIPTQFTRRGATLHGVVAAVRDGDNVRVRHIPKVQIFRWLGRRRGAKQGSSTLLSQTTINVRLAGIDAPECVHGLRPGQPYGVEARTWLRKFALGRKVSFQLHAMDQYRRVIATVYTKNSNPLLRLFGFGSRNVGLELTRAGYATLYRGSGAQYGGARRLRQYMHAEEAARRARRGMWENGADKVTSPNDFKRMIKSSTFSTADEAKRNQFKETGITRFLQAAIDGYRWLKRFR